MLEEICLHQFTKQKSCIKVDGVGDCYTCLPNGKNYECLRYYPITVGIYEVKEDG